MDNLLKLPEVMAVTKLSRNGVYKFMRKGLFPECIKVGRASFWSEVTIQEWIEARRKQVKLNIPTQKQHSHLPEWK
jgi:predicted DNA-binding transcriptional regulator AlpA